MSSHASKGAAWLAARMAACRRRSPTLSQVGIFCAVGLAAMVVDYAVFVPLVQLDVLDPRLAALVGYLVSSAGSYWLNWRITFERPPLRSHLRGLGAFVVAGAGGAAIRVAAMQVIFLAWGWSRPPLVYLSSFVGIVAGAAVNYLGARYWVFRSQRP